MLAGGACDGWKDGGRGQGEPPPRAAGPSLAALPGLLAWVVSAVPPLLAPTGSTPPPRVAPSLWFPFAFVCVTHVRPVALRAGPSAGTRGTGSTALGPLASWLAPWLAGRSDHCRPCLWQLLTVTRPRLLWASCSSPESHGRLVSGCPAARVCAAAPVRGTLTRKHEGRCSVLLPELGVAGLSQGNPAPSRGARLTVLLRLSRHCGCGASLRSLAIRVFSSGVSGSLSCPLESVY